MGFNSAFKGLTEYPRTTRISVYISILFCQCMLFIVCCENRTSA